MKGNGDIMADKIYRINMTSLTCISWKKYRSNGKGLGAGD